MTQSVVGYEVEVTTGTGGAWTGAGTGCARGATKSSTALTCTASGLTAGAYSFRVAAVKKNLLTRATKTAGFSPGSPVATVIAVPGTPGRPTVVAGAGKVTVTVAAGTATDGTPGGVPSSYTVTRTPATTPPTTCTVTGAPWSCDVTGLATGIAYAFTATATNAAGTSGASTPSAPVTLVAVSVPKFTVTYRDQLVLGAVPKSRVVELGKSVTVAANVATSCDGCWAFGGWSPDPDASEPIIYSAGDSISPTANLQLFALWTPMTTFEANGGSGTMPARFLGFESNVPWPTFTNGNLRFVGWNTKADGTGTLYYTWLAVPPPIKTVTKLTLYAQWRTQFVFKFDPNGGTGAIAPETVADDDIYHFYKAVHDNYFHAFKRDGYYVDSWCPYATVSNPEEQCLSYTKVSTLKLGTDVTYFARWLPGG